ncbi:hypothetical protein MGYG_06523 [Nannizzia gypsea CBS 118893]|uniref:Xaa-Pro dipeptidyl-peptidase-like domain-containing protein n=1 Tax=Arthroderma gypseum (strain ATCC MYA-4604 / CBS 118893) TaxID=535722 RepID=E4UZJ6_ARTGP|nr:hypothetical protein MGYG_06523 [Nannizzia gypsea CBS 118893]EFR03526.1 hypothetical protein MGYG_06523 [Nannizzia gypsea CBS 118893]
MLRRPPADGIANASSIVHRNRPWTTNVSRTLPPTRSLSLLLSVPPILVPPVVLIGLTITLWLYKCAMMVIFQNKIIYMPSMPPFSRQERIASYEKVCSPIFWEEQRIKSLDGVEIALCVGRNVAKTDEREVKKMEGREGEVVILYFQGNGSSIPPRLPQLSGVLKALDDRTYTLIAVSYRGFWTSRGRASQRGIERDAIAALKWARKTYPDLNTQLVFWGQSIGAGVATFLAASDHRQHDCARRSEPPALILETPFVSVQSMLLALYPQRWLPYRYLGPFLRNWWDSEEALRAMSNTGAKQTVRRRVLVISAENDELVPPEQGDFIEDLCIEQGMDVSRTRVRGALHTEATFRGGGRNAVVSFLKQL